MIRLFRQAFGWVNQQATPLLLFTTLFWAGNVVAGRLAVGRMSPMAMVFLRWTIVAVLLAGFAGETLRRDWPALKARWPMVVFGGALGFTGFNALFYLGAQYTVGVNIAILQGAIPLFVLLFGVAFTGMRLRPMQMVGVALTLLGILVLASRGDLAALGAMRFNIGDVLMIVACALYATYALSLRNPPKASPLGLFTALAIVAALTSLPLLALEFWRGEGQWPTPSGWLVVAFVALGPSFVSQLTFMRGVKLIGPARAGLFANLVPVFGALMSVVLLGEEPHLFHAVALALVLGGIFVAERLGKPAG